jgi:hypothetical protein
MGRRRSLDNGSLLLVPRTTLAQAQKPRLPTKNGSMQDGTILGIRRLGNLRCRSGCRPDGRGWLNPKWVPIPTAVAAKSSRARYFRYSAAESAHSWPVNLAALTALDDQRQSGWGEGKVHGLAGLL